MVKTKKTFPIGIFIIAAIAVLILAVVFIILYNTSVSLSPVDLMTARKGFITRHMDNSYKPDGPAPAPPKNIFESTLYTSPAGKLIAYITPDPRDGKRHPAVLWAHGGFGGIGSWFWEPATPDDDQTARAFREAGVVLMCPSWRGENDNPGMFELFYGEVDDLLAAREYLARLPYVDSQRIYLAGHSTGGTIALLGAEVPGNFRAAFSFGGAPDLRWVLFDGTGYGNTPFYYKNTQEVYLRSPIHFVKFIKQPTFYFEGEDSSYIRDAMIMQRMAKESNIPFTAFIVKGGDHFSILAPLTNMIAYKILQDTGPQCNITVSEDEVMRALNSVNR